MKYRIAKLEDVAENLRGLYREDATRGGFVLDVEGAVDKDRLDEFRNNNIQLQQQIDKYKDIDPTKYNELMDIQRKIQEKEYIEKGEIEKLVGLRTNEMKRTFETQIADLTKTNQLNARQLETLTIDNAVREHATKLGVQPTAVDDVLLRAKTVFKLHEGKPTPFGSDGNVVYGKDGTSPMAIGEYIDGLKTQAPHLFQPSTGSGAGGSGGGAGPRGNNGSANLNPTQKIAEGMRQGLTTG
jgi:hypothetical protein